MRQKIEVSQESSTIAIKKDLIKIEETVSPASFTDDSTFLMHETESEWVTEKKILNTSILSPEEIKKSLNIP